MASTIVIMAQNGRVLKARRRLPLPSYRQPQSLYSLSLAKVCKVHRTDIESIKPQLARDVYREVLDSFFDIDGTDYFSPDELKYPCTDQEFVDSMRSETMADVFFNDSLNVVAKYYQRCTADEMKEWQRTHDFEATGRRIKHCAKCWETPRVGIYRELTWNNVDGEFAWMLTRSRTIHCGICKIQPLYSIHESENSIF